MTVGLLAEGVALANIPTLLMVLVQLTGELRWLEPPYRPRPAGGMSDNDTGRLSDEVQAEIRDAALEAIIAWQQGRPVAIPEPSPELLVRMLSCAMGEDVPINYAPMMAVQNGLRPLVADPIADIPDDFIVLVIGAGISGLAMAVNLQSAGIPYRIVEKSNQVGGTWRDNRYPGAGVDSPNHLYSYTFAPYDWSRFFAPQQEVHAYLEHVTDLFGLRSKIEFETEVEAVVFDPGTHNWSVTVRRSDGSCDTLVAKVVITAAGIFNPPSVPAIQGLDSFDGPCFHTAEWPDDIDLAGKRVAVIGNGASAMQLCPAIQDTVGSLTIFQKTPHWAAPFEHFKKPVPDALRYLFKEVPLYRHWYRTRLGWTWNDRFYEALHKDPDWPHPERSLNATNDAQREFFTQYAVSELGDRADLADLVVPTYPPFGKRMLLDNGWYRMLRNEKVELIGERISEVRGNEVVTAGGRTVEVDVVIFATGFDVLRFLSAFDVVGRSGTTLREVWGDDDARAYLSTLVPDFPNLFVLYGPNSQPGHGGSFIFLAEMIIHYVMSVLRQMISEDLASVEVRQEVHDAYNEAMEREHEQMVWTHPGMETYFRNSKGRVVLNYPFRNIDLWNSTRHADLGDFIVEPRLNEEMR